MGLLVRWLTSIPFDSLDDGVKILVMLVSATIISFLLLGALFFSVGGFLFLAEIPDARDYSRQVAWDYIKDVKYPKTRCFRMVCPVSDVPKELDELKRDFPSWQVHVGPSVAGPEFRALIGTKETTLAQN